MKRHFEAELDEITRLVLVRHGRTAANDQGRILGMTDEPLDAHGRQQVALLAKRMDNFPVSAIYTSPLARAQQTAAAIATRKNLVASSDGDLVEYEFGDLSDLSMKDLEQKNPKLHAQVLAWMNMGCEPTMSRPQVHGAESMANLLTRINRFKAKIVAEHSGEVVVAVTHGGFIKSMLTVLTGGSLDQRLPFWLDNASISVVDLYKGVPCIRLFNDVCHLGISLSYGRPVFL